MRVTSFAPVLLVSTLLFLPACASKPTLYPNEKYERVGKSQANADIEACEKKAEAYVKNERGKNAASGAASGAIFGAVVGGLLGGTRGIGRGAVGGGVVGGTAGALSPKQLHQRFVTTCLTKMGYEVVGY